MMTEKMKTSEKLYRVNADISALCFIKKEQLTLKEMEAINVVLGEIIKEIRELENDKR